MTIYYKTDKIKVTTQENRHTSEAELASYL